MKAVSRAALRPGRRDTWAWACARAAQGHRPSGRGAAAALLLLMGQAGAATAPPDAAAIGQLVEAATLDAMTEASVRGCVEMGVAQAPALQTAFADWRSRHQLPLLRSVVLNLAARQHRDPPWKAMSEAMKQRVLDEPQPEKACETLQRDWSTPTMDASALYPAAVATARALIAEKLARAPEPLPVVPGPLGGGQVLSVAQLLQQVEQARASGTGAQARRPLADLLVRGRIVRWMEERVSFTLEQDDGVFSAQRALVLRFDAEALLGREVVLRGTVQDPRAYTVELSDAAWVSDPSGLQPSPLPAQALRRKPVPLARVTAKPGQGLQDKALAAVVLHGHADYSNGSQWREEVRFLLRDGSAYLRTEMPPDQLDLSRSRRLEPQQWGRWRARGDHHDFQAQDDHGAPTGSWEPGEHRPMRPWAPGTRIEGSFSRSAFYGSLFTGGTASTRSIRFTRDGRFERSFHSQSGSGSLAAVQGTVIHGSAYGDGKGSQSVAGGTVGTGLGSVTTTTAPNRKDDGASRRGSYTLSGYAAVLRYDDGHEERLLSFPVDESGRSVYLGEASYTQDK